MSDTVEIDENCVEMRIRLANEEIACSVTASFFNWQGDLCWFLFRLKTEQGCRQMGYASRLLKLAVEYCEKQKRGKGVYLSPAPFADAPMDAHALMRFYQRQGFTVVSTNPYIMKYVGRRV